MLTASAAAPAAPVPVEPTAPAPECSGSPNGHCWTQTWVRGDYVLLCVNGCGATR